MLLEQVKFMDGIVFQYNSLADAIIMWLEKTVGGSRSDGFAGFVNKAYTDRNLGCSR